MEMWVSVTVLCILTSTLKVTGQFVWTGLTKITICALYTEPNSGRTVPVTTGRQPSRFEENAVHRMDVDVGPETGGRTHTVIKGRQ
jgi:hypothetical protein